MDEYNYLQQRAEREALAAASATCAAARIAHLQLCETYLSRSSDLQAQARRAEITLAVDNVGRSRATDSEQPAP